MTKNDNLYDIRRPNMRGAPHNKTTLFMLPSIGFREDKTSIKSLRYYGFVNCYLSHKQSVEDYPDCLILLFNPLPEALSKFKDFYAIYKTYPNFVDDYIIDYGLIAVVFRVLPKWLPSFNEFKRSHYSGMSKEYAELFKRVEQGTNVTRATDEYFIMRKDKNYKKRLEESFSLYTNDYSSPVIIDDEAELMEPLDMSKEILDYGRAIEIQPWKGQC